MGASATIGLYRFFCGRLFCGLFPQMCLERFGKLSVNSVHHLPVRVPIGHYPSLPDNLLQHSAHTLAVGGRQIIALVEGARSGQGVAIFHRPIEHVGTRALQAEGAALPGDVFLYKHTQAGI